MNRRESRLGGDTMKRLIALLVAVVFCVTLFSPTITADIHDSKNPPPPIDRNELSTGSGDDGGWDDPVYSPPPGHEIPMIFLTFWFPQHFGTTFFGFIIDTSVTLDTDTNGPENENSIQRDQRTNPK